MADLQAILERQSSKVDELREQAESAPSIASLQALASIFRDRADTHAALQQPEKALEDWQAASALLAQLILGAGRDDLLETFVEVGEKLRDALRAIDREDEALDNALSETQVLAALGQAARAAALLRRLADQQEATLGREPALANLDRLLKTLSVLAGTLLGAEKLEEALEVEDRAVAAAAAFVPAQPDRLASMRSNRALTRAGLGRGAEALAELDEVIASYDGLLEGAVELPRLAAALEARSRRGQLLVEQGRVDEGMQALHETVALAARLAPPGDARAAALHRGALRVLAETARMRGRHEEALEAAESWAAAAQAAADAGGDLGTIEELLEATYERALALHLLGRHELALEDANQLVATWDRIAQEQPGRPDIHQRVLMVLDLRERSASALGRHEEALADQSLIIGAIQQLVQQGAPPQLLEGLVTTLERRAKTLEALGRSIEAQRDRDVLRQIVQRISEATSQPRGPIL